jgi:hypothetical protein
MPETKQPECAEQKRLYEELTLATKAVVEIQSSQIAALQLGDRRVSHFEEEIDSVVRAWKHARKAFMQHITDHGCGPDCR